MKKGIIFTLMLAALWACQDLNSINPPDEIDLHGQYGQYVDTLINASQTAFKVDQFVNTGNAQKLNIGSYEGFSAGFLMTFISLPTDTVQIDSAYIELASYSKFGDGADDMQVSVYKVEKDWEEAKANTQQEWHDYQPSNLVGQYTFPASDSLRLRFDLDTTLVNDWRRYPDTNKGLYFKVENENLNYIRSIESLEVVSGEDWPRFCIYFQQGDTLTKKDSSRAGYDATIFNYQGDLFELAEQQNDILIGSGIASRAFVRFNALDSLPKTALIQDADIIMGVNDKDIRTNEPGNKLDNPKHSENYYLHSLLEADSAFDTYEIDSSFTTNTNFLYYLIEQDSSLSLNGRSERSKFGLSMIQNKINGIQESAGFYIQYLNENQDISIKRIKNDIKMRLRYFIVENDGL